MGSCQNVVRMSFILLTSSLWYTPLFLPCYDIICVVNNKVHTLTNEIYLLNIAFKVSSPIPLASCPSQPLLPPPPLMCLNTPSFPSPTLPSLPHAKGQGHLHSAGEKRSQMLDCGYLTKILVVSGDVNTWHTSLSSSPLCYCHCEGAVKRVFLSTSDPPTLAAVSDHELMVQMSDSNGQWTCIESKHYEDKVSSCFLTA